MKILLCVLLLGVAVPVAAQDLASGQVLHDTSWFRDCAYFVPSSLQSVADGTCRKMISSAPISNRQIEPIVFDPTIYARVVHLSQSISPAAVRLAIRPVIVDPVQFGSGRTPAHISQECLVIGPCLADRDSPATIVGIRSVSRVKTSCPHMAPDPVFLCSMALAMCARPSDNEFSTVAAATNGGALHQGVHLNRTRDTAIASTEQMLFPSDWTRLKGDDSPSPESLPNAVSSSRAFHTLRIQQNRVSEDTKEDPHEGLFQFSMAAVVVANSMDLAETEHCLGAGRCRELNPWLVRFDNPSGFAIAKMGVVTAQIWLVAKLHELFPKAAIAVNVISAALFTGIAIHNSRAGQ